jgi:hypothetical protein
MGMSQREYAQHRGVSHTAVRKAVKASRITTLPDGTIDPETADREWDRNTRPNASAIKHAAKEGSPVSTEKDPVSTRKAAPPVSQSIDEDFADLAGEPVKEHLEPQGHGGALKRRKRHDDDLEPSPAALALARGEDVPDATIVDAVFANELLKIRARRLANGQKSRELIDRAMVTSRTFEMARTFRDGFVAWVSRTAPVLAAEFGIDAHAFGVALDREVREYLAGVAGVSVKLDS